MSENMTEQQAREQILKEVSAYCDTFHNQEKPFAEGDRIPYASRVYDHDEMVNLPILEFVSVRSSIPVRVPICSRS